MGEPRRMFDPGTDNTATAAGRALDANYISRDECHRLLIEAVRAAEKAGRQAAAPLTVERLAAALRELGFVRGMARTYGKFNDAYWEQSAAAILAALEGDADE